MVRPTDVWGIGAVIGEINKIVEAIVDSDRKTKGTVVEGSLIGRFLAAKNADGSTMTMQDVKNELLTAMQEPLPPPVFYTM